MKTTPRHHSLTAALCATIESTTKAFAEMSEQMDRERREREARRKARSTQQERSQ